MYKKTIRPNQLINIEQIIGPPIAPRPKIMFKPPPAATNFSLGFNHLLKQD